MNIAEPEFKSDQSATRLVYPWKPDDHGHGPANLLRKNITRSAKRTREALSSWNFLDWLSFFLPCVVWLRTYKWRRWLVNDIVAGLSVGFMVVPQGMSYASLAGLPSVFGLYGAFLPCLVYCLVGSSKQLSVGPVAVTSLLLAADLRGILTCTLDIPNPNSPPEGLQSCQDQYNAAAIQVCFLVACMYTGMGVLHVGWVTKFLSHAVIGGFTTGAAIIIAMGQAKYIFGFKISMGSSTKIQDYASQYIHNMHNLRWQEFIMGMTFIFILIAVKEAQRFWKPMRHIRSLGAIIVCIIGISTVYIGKVDTTDRGGIAIVGSIPSGLPPYTGNKWLPMNDPGIGQLFPTAIIILVVALLESTSIARALARKNGYELSYNREIVGLGLANFAGALSSTYTTTGSFSRSAVNNNAGAKTPLAQFICGWVVGFVLIFLTGPFSKVPFNAMGAIVIVSVASLVEYEQAMYLWKVNKLDLCCFLASCFGTLFYSVEVGLGIAVGLAVFITIHQSAFPHTAVLGKVPGSSYVYRNVKQYPDSQVYPGILAFRIDAPLYFANVNSLEDKVEKAIIKASAWSAVQGIPSLKFLILDLTPVHHVDSMGLRFLEDLIFETKDKGIQLILANPNRNVVRDWERVKLPELLGREFVFVSVNEATLYALRRLSEQGYTTTPLALPTSSSAASLAMFPPKGTSSNGGPLPPPSSTSVSTDTVPATIGEDDADKSGVKEWSGGGLNGVIGQQSRPSSSQNKHRGSKAGGG